MYVCILFFCNFVVGWMNEWMNETNNNNLVILKIHLVMNNKALLFLGKYYKVHK